MIPFAEKRCKIKFRYRYCYVRLRQRHNAARGLRCKSS